MAPSTFPQQILALNADALNTAITRGEHDAVVVVGAGPLSKASLAAPLHDAIVQAESADASLVGVKANVTCVPAPGLVGGRLVISLTDPLSNWEVDVRAFATAASNGMNRAVIAGAKRPLFVLVTPEKDARFKNALEVAALGALFALWRPLEARLQGKVERVVQTLAVGPVDSSRSDGFVSLVESIERARILARDIGGTEPEVMAPEGVARTCVEAFQGTTVKVDVLGDANEIAKSYPLVHAVARASLAVPRHHPRVVRLAYEGEGPIEKTLLFAGKGLTYDTGGADLKTEGHMAGMSRDKGGAAAVAGLFQLLAERKPRGVKAVALLGAVRNSIGSDAYVTDEIVVARSKVRVRIGNTDAEGRLVLADLLAALVEEAKNAVNPQLFTVATLTGHAALAHGPLTALVENGAAVAAQVGEQLERVGDAWGDPCARTRLRAEDYAFIAGRTAAEDVISCNALPSARTPRGHQFPAAFLDIVSGLRAHNASAEHPVPFVHVDVAGSAVIGGNWQTGTPTAAPIIAMAHAFGLL